MSGTNLDPKQMDAEIGALILTIPESNTYPSRELQVSNAFIQQHPEYEQSRTEVYVAYVRVITQMKKDGKLTDSGAPTSPSILTRTPPVSKPTAEARDKKSAGVQKTPKTTAPDGKTQDSGKKEAPKAGTKEFFTTPFTQEFIENLRQKILHGELRKVPQGGMVIRRGEEFLLLKKRDTQKLQAMTPDGKPAGPAPQPKPQDKVIDGKKEAKPVDPMPDGKPPVPAPQPKPKDKTADGKKGEKASDPNPDGKPAPDPKKP